MQKETNEKRKTKRKKKKRNLTSWNYEENAKLFNLFRLHGTNWPLIKKFYPGKTETQVKNRFYSTLRRVANKNLIERNTSVKEVSRMCKHELLKYTNEAIKNGHNTYSKRGRRSKKDKDIKMKEDPYLVKMPEYVERIKPQDLSLNQEASNLPSKWENMLLSVFTSRPSTYDLIRSYPSKASMPDRFCAETNDYFISIFPCVPTMANGWGLVPMPYLLENEVLGMSKPFISGINENKYKQCGIFISRVESV